MKFKISFHLVSFLAVFLTAAPIAGCGSGENEAVDLSREIVETGVIEITDATDPNHSNLLFDGFEFEAEKFEKACIEAASDEFVPLLKLVEVETGAVLAEWEAEYSSDEALTYTIAGSGIYEARIYAMENGTGQYTITITMEP